MALRRTLARRFFNAVDVPEGPSLLRRLCLSSGEDRRILLHRRPMFRSEVRVPFQGGDQLIDRIRSVNPDRVRLEGLFPPPTAAAAAAAERVGMSVDEAKKAIRASQMEAARERLRMVPYSCVSYSEFARICGEIVDGGRWLPRALDESGSVIVLGDAVILRPELIAKAIECMLSTSSTDPQNDPHWKALREMEAKKVEIDAKAEAQVKRELWCGLGLLALQTAGFMRLTFWELSWDVMEPICFFVTSIYFMGGYGFFLRTSRDPSFEGFFESRFAAKQKRLIKAHKFDLNKFNELKKLYYPYRPTLEGHRTSPPFGCHQ